MEDLKQSIDRLRSPTWAHPDYISTYSLQDYMYSRRTDREQEIFEVNSAQWTIQRSIHLFSTLGSFEFPPALNSFVFKDSNKEYESGFEKRKKKIWFENIIFVDHNLLKCFQTQSYCHLLFGLLVIL